MWTSLPPLRPEGDDPVLDVSEARAFLLRPRGHRGEDPGEARRAVQLHVCLQDLQGPADDEGSGGDGW